MCIMASIQRKWKSGRLLGFLCWSPTASRAKGHHSPHTVSTSPGMYCQNVTLLPKLFTGPTLAPSDHAPSDHAHQDPKPEESQPCWQTLWKLRAQRHDPASHEWDTPGASFTCHKHQSIAVQGQNEKHKLPFSLGGSAPVQLSQ